MAITEFSLEVSQPFDFWSVLQSHGWVDLLPNSCLADPISYTRIEELPSGKVVKLDISTIEENHQQLVLARIDHQRRLSERDSAEIKKIIRHMLRLDEDFSGFYALCKQQKMNWSKRIIGKGRLLRSPTLFEDFVKVICTTNIQWGGTRRMVAELVAAYGKPFPGHSEWKAFPIPGSIASESLSEFQSKVRLGYRAAYIYELAVQITSGEVKLGEFTDPGRSTQEIKKSLLSIKGVGSYAAASLLMLLGRYDEIPVDTVFQQFMCEKYFRDCDFDLKGALTLYENWGKWKYLAYWYDMLTHYQLAEKSK